MQILTHTSRFRDGIRVLLLKGRYKDGLTEQRTMTRISLTEEEYDCALAELQILAREGERIYATANRRSLPTAARLLQERQLDAHYEPDDTPFYEHLQDRWVSCLMKCPAKIGKLWMFDVDTTDEDNVMRAWMARGDMKQNYWYDTKNGGKHVFIQPINKTMIPLELRACLHIDPLMLVGY